MLKRVGVSEDGAMVLLKDAKFPSPFSSGLEFAAPARGTWNIVHTGMLLPESHEIFVCAANCLRGVVLTAAEMGESCRFSTVEIKENNVLDGDMEELLINGVTDIIEKLEKKPRAVLVYTSCIHHFIGCDLDMCYSSLRRRFPDIAFTDCYMNPIMRKSGLTPDELMRRQLYSLLEKRPKKEKTVNIIGGDFKTDDSSDLVRLIKKAGWHLSEIMRCNSYDEYLDMAQASLDISLFKGACAGGEYLEKTHGIRHLYMPQSYNPEKIIGQMTELAEILGTKYDENGESALSALDQAKKLIGDTPVAIDYTAVPYPLSLAQLLAKHGFNVTRIYADGFMAEEKDEFEALKELLPDIELYATVHPKMRVLSRTTDTKTLAIGQKAAYFTGTKNFVNIVEGAGMYGFDAILKMAELMKDAFLHEQDTPKLIGQKGWGCSCLL